MKKSFTLVLFAALLAFTSCISINTNVSANVPLSFEILKQETYGGREKASNVVIKSQEELNSLYKELGWENVPQVDFGIHNVVAAFMGQKNTGGYSISVKKVSVEGDTATVTLKETRPEPGGVATTALSAPYCIVIIPKTSNVEINK